MRYRTIVADPPWEIAKRIGKGGRRANETEVSYAGRIGFLLVYIGLIPCLPVAVAWRLA